MSRSNKNAASERPNRIEPPPAHRILLVDDEPSTNIEPLSELLSAHYRIHTAADAETALALLRERNDQPEPSEHIHVIISDQRMPGMKGTELLRTCKERHPNTARILLTAFSDREAIVECANEIDVFRYLNKPVRGDEIERTVAKAVEYYELSKENERLLNLCMKLREHFAPEKARFLEEMWSGLDGTQLSHGDKETLMSTLESLVSPQPGPVPRQLK